MGYWIKDVFSGLSIVALLSTILTWISILERMAT